MINLSTIKYFIYNISRNNNLYLPLDIRKLIWEYYHIVNIIQCNICNKVLLDFNVNILYRNNELIENYSIINGNAKCDKCFID